MVLFLLAGGLCSARAGEIENVTVFLDRCPASDPALARILSDFEIRRDGVLVSLPACTEPVSAMATAEYTDELIVLQTFRTIQAMDRGDSGHLPWTAGTLYDWMAASIDGIDIGPGLFCCTEYDGKLFISIGASSDANREFDKSWIGIAGNISVYAHEVRHANSDGYPHSSCCGTTNGCDTTFDAANLSPYGVSWWLNNLWMNGTINVGYSCFPPQQRDDTTTWFLIELNTLRDRFCTNAPPSATASEYPGGACVGIPIVNATGQSSSVAVTWPPASNATDYEVQRRAAGGAFEAVTITATPSVTDSNVTNDAYAYRVRARDSSARPGNWSRQDPAVVGTYTDDPPIAQQTLIRHAHVTELRDSVARLRLLAGIASYPFTDPTPETIRAVHFTELRAALPEALTALGTAPPELGTAPAAGGVIAGTHLQVIRSGTR